MTQERINEILAIVDRAKEYDGINYALERAINELIREVQALAEKRSKGCDLCMPVNTLIESLQAQTKVTGEKGCEYCEDSCMPLWWNNAGHPTSRMIDPNFCPMCGKRLEVEHGE